MLQLAKYFTLLALFFLLGAFNVEAQSTAITIESVNARPGEQIVVPVYMNSNDIDIAALTIPLKYNSFDVYVDSISFIGSLVQPNMAALSYINNNEQEFSFTYVPSSGIPLIREEAGLLAKVYFTVSAGALEQTVIIDPLIKVEYIGDIEIWTKPEIADSTGLNSFGPAFEPGIISVFSPLDADNGFAGIPTVLELKQNYPNPFNPSTTISYSLPEQAFVSLKIYNILGQEIETLVDETKSAGVYEVDWESKTAASGIYFYRLNFGGKILTKKMTLLK